MHAPLRSHLGYVVFATASISLAVGASLVVFSLVNALWLKPAPFNDVDRLVMLLSEDSVGLNDGATFGGVEDAAAWSAFEAVAGQVATSGHSSGLRPRIFLAESDAQIEIVGVTSRYFSLLGLGIRGRDFRREDNRYGAEPVAIISDRFWSRAFNRDEAILGSMIAARPVPLRIIGVAPAGFVGARRGERIDIWIPANLVPRVAPAGDIPEDAVPTLVLARLRLGQTPAAAKRHFIDDARSDWERNVRSRVVLAPLSKVFGSPDTRSVFLAGDRTAGLVVGMTALVLVAGCATLMSLVLVHYERRRRELAIRMALGASRARLIVAMAREMASLAALGIAIALAGSQWSLAAAPSLILPGGVVLDRLDLTIDWRIVAAAILTTAVTLVAAALLPMSRFTKSSLVTDLVGTYATPTRSSHRLRQWLLGVHVAATIVVLVAAGLFVRAVAYGFDVGAGFDVDRTVFLRAQLAPPFISPSGADAHTALITSRRLRLEEELRKLPGVEIVANGSSPIGPDQTSLLLRSRTLQARGRQHTVQIGAMPGSPEQLRALGVPLLRGRQLTVTDATTHPQPVLVTASLARTLWPSDDPLGQTLTHLTGARETTSVIVGVTADLAYGSLTQHSAGVILNVPRWMGGLEPGYVLRTPEPDVIAAAVQRLVQEVVPDAPRVFVATGRRIVEDDIGRQRLGAWFFSGFGLASLLLGLGGIFGLIAYLAESRRREFGVKLALGATPQGLVARGVAAGLMPVILGSSAGLLVAGLTSRSLHWWLPGLSALDPVVYAVVVAVTVGGAAVAATAAAWRLRGTELARALRAE